MHILRISKLALLNSKKKVQNLTKNDYSALVSAHQTPRTEMSVTQLLPIDSTLTKAHSSRQTVNNRKDVTPFKSIMDKQTNFLKNTIKIHKRKLNYFRKENAELLTEY